MGKQPMTQKEWESLLEKLDKLLREFLIEYHPYKNGSNAKTRETAERKLNSTILTAQGLIHGNSEAYELFAGEVGLGQFSAEAFREFGMIQYFDYELQAYLKKIKKKIADLEENKN